jgi:hypothetical protein
VISRCLDRAGSLRPSRRRGPLVRLLVVRRVNLRVVLRRNQQDNPFPRLRVSRQVTRRACQQASRVDNLQRSRQANRRLNRLLSLPFIQLSNRVLVPLFSQVVDQPLNQ